MRDNPQEWTPDMTPVSIFNPLDDDVVVKYLNDKNQEQTVVLGSIQMSTHPKYLADLLTKRLVDAIINDRNLGFLTEEEKLEIVNETKV